MLVIGCQQRYIYTDKKYCTLHYNWTLTARVVKRQAGQGGRTAHAAPTVFCPFQKHIVVKLAGLLSNGSGASKIFNRNKLTHKLYLWQKWSYYKKECTHAPNTTDIFGTGLTLFGRSDVSQSVAGPSRLQLCAALGSSSIKLSEYIIIIIIIIIISNLSDDRSTASS
jgi:hypothetical protein